MAEGLSGHPHAAGPNVAGWAEVLWFMTSMLAFYLLYCFLFTKINKGEKPPQKSLKKKCRYCGVRW